MKKILILSLLMLQGCAPTANFYLNNSIAVEPKKEGFIVFSPDKSVATTKLIEYFTDYLKNSGYKVVDTPSKAKYGFVFSIKTDTWQSMRSVPVWGKTGISSINTHSFGTANTNLNGHASQYGNTTYINGNATSSYSGNTFSTVNYNYGITGYQNIIDNNYLKSFYAILIDNKTQNILGEFKISTGEYINDDDFVNVIQNMYATTPLFISVQKNLYCEQGICEIPVSPFSKMF